MTAAAKRAMKRLGRKKWTDRKTMVRRQFHRRKRHF
jgi:hypothetical protein